MAKSLGGKRIVVERLPNGYWKATITLPWSVGPGDYTQSCDAFHDELEARDWADWMVGYLTESLGCADDATAVTREAR